jgi:hypothetical protein
MSVLPKYETNSTKEINIYNGFGAICKPFVFWSLPQRTKPSAVNMGFHDLGLKIVKKYKTLVLLL